MSKTKRRGLVLTGIIILLPFASRGQDAAPDPPASSRPWKFYGTLDSVYSDNFSHPADGVNLLRNFDSQANAFQLSAATIGVQYMGDHVGFHLDAGYGQMYQTIGTADPWRGVNQYIGQLYVSYKPLTNNNLQFDAGKFYTSACAEVPDVLSNFNYSRSLLFVLGVPYYHFGLRATVPLNKSFTVGAQVMNGWNDVVDNNHGKTIGLTSSLVKAKWGWTETYIVGPEKTNSDQGYRHLYDNVVTVTPNSRVEGYVEVLVGMEHRAQLVGGRDSWVGGAAALRFKPAKNWSFSPRWEYFSDSTGFMTGTAQHLTEWTATADYHPHPMMTWRLEYRADHSNEPFFGSHKDQQTALLALILSAKRER